MRTLQHNIVYLIVLLLMGAGAFVAHAQTDPVQYIVSPEVPGPNQLVRIEVQGIGPFLGDSTITWQVNNKTVLAGVGEKVFTFTTGAVGVATHVHLDIESSVQGSITHDFTFIPATVNLVWEANTTVPPLYEGKALYSAGSRITVLALPQVVSGVKTITSNNLSFRWSVNGSPDTADSGTGRSSLTFVGSQLRSGEQVSLDVYLGDVRVAQGNLYIPATSPMLMLYVDDPLRGVLYDQALPPSVTLGGQEITLKAEPYYFSADSLQSGVLSYDWSLNGTQTSGTDSAQGMLTLRQTGAGAGTSNVEVSLQNNDPMRLVQAASIALRILFGGQQSSSNASTFGI